MGRGLDGIGWGAGGGGVRASQNFTLGVVNRHILTVTTELRGGNSTLSSKISPRRPDLTSFGQWRSNTENSTYGK